MNVTTRATLAAASESVHRLANFDAAPVRTAQVRRTYYDHQSPRGGTPPSGGQLGSRTTATLQASAASIAALQGHSLALQLQLECCWKAAASLQLW